MTTSLSLPTPVSSKDVENQIVVVEPGSLADLLPTNLLLVGLDTETDMQKRLITIQLAMPDNPVLVVDWRTITADDRAALSHLLQSKTIKVMQGGVFDIEVLRRVGIELTLPVFDTLLASRYVRQDTKEHKLQTLCEDLLGIELDKTEQTTFTLESFLTPEQIQYGAMDAAVLLPLRLKLIELSKSLKTSPIIFMREFKVTPAIAQVHARGIGVAEQVIHADIQRWQQWIADNPLLVKECSQQILLDEDSLTPVDVTKRHWLRTAVKLLEIEVDSATTDDLLPLLDKHPELKPVLLMKLATQQLGWLQKLQGNVKDSKVGCFYNTFNQQGLLGHSKTGLEKLPQQGVPYLTSTLGEGQHWVWANFNLPHAVLDKVTGNQPDPGYGYQDTPPNLRRLLGQYLKQITLDYPAPYFGGSPDDIQQAIASTVAEVLIEGVGVYGWAEKRVQRLLYERGVLMSLVHVKFLVGGFWSFNPKLKDYHKQVKKFQVKPNFTLLRRYQNQYGIPIEEKMAHLVYGTLSDLMKEAIIVAQDIEGIEVRAILGYQIAFVVDSSEALDELTQSLSSLLSSTFSPLDVGVNLSISSHDSHSHLSSNRTTRH